jgi:hypothetical protein
MKRLIPALAAAAIAFSASAQTTPAPKEPRDPAHDHAIFMVLQTQGSVMYLERGSFNCAAGEHRTSLIVFSLKSMYNGCAAIKDDNMHLVLENGMTLDVKLPEENTKPSDTGKRKAKPKGPMSQA